MPHPIDLLLDPISLTAMALYAAMMLWERIAPARELPFVKGWKLTGVVAFLIFFFLSSYLPLIWTDTLAAHRLVDLTGLGTLGGAMAALLVYELGVYLWHRSMHRSKVLWRTFHQMHHSAERLDTFGAFYFSPLDMIAWTFLSSFCLTVIVGISAQATTVFLLATTFLSVFQHANVRTPHWLGYFIQRPESHSLHHAKGVHAYNYSDLPVFDMLFRTFRNPAVFVNESGFFHGASYRVMDMLLFRDINHSPSSASQSASDAHEQPHANA